MKRVYEEVLCRHFEENGPMFFLSGPRQSGKTSTALQLKGRGDVHYFNWDNQDHQTVLRKGPSEVIRTAGLDILKKELPFIIFDEIHKYFRWKEFLKGFYDTYRERGHIVVTGSSRLDLYKRGGDSLMGRYFPYRMHPFSLREILTSTLPSTEISSPIRPPVGLMDQLMQYGGFPDPFLKADHRFVRRWRKLRQQQLFYEDIRDLSRVQEIKQMELLSQLLQENAGGLLNYTRLAQKIRVSVDTIRRWFVLLESFYYCFRLSPYSKNVTRSLLKEPKVYLWDWSGIAEEGKRLENMVACHLLKWVHFWTDLGGGEYDLYFLRDKEQREVDFLVTKDKIPWFLVEVKRAAGKVLSPHLSYFARQVRTKHAFQVVFDLPFVDKNCFEEEEPIKVPLATFLSQLA